MTRHFVTPAGVYIGGFCEASKPPKGGIEVFTAPSDAREIWSDGAWAMPMATVKVDAMVAMISWIEEFLNTFVSRYPKQEVESWSLLAIAAREHVNGAPQPMILEEAAITGEAPDELATSILQRSGLYTAIINRTRGLRRVTVRAIEAAETPEQVASALEMAKRQAQEMLAAIANAEPPAKP